MYIIFQGEGLTAPQLVNRGAEQWKEMTEEEKQPYVERSQRYISHKQPSLA